MFHKYSDFSGWHYRDSVRLSKKYERPVKYNFTRPGCNKID